VRQVWIGQQRYLKLHLTTHRELNEFSFLGFDIESDNNPFTGYDHEGLDYWIGFSLIDEYIYFDRYDKDDWVLLGDWVPLDPNGIEYELTYAWKDANVPPVATGITFTFPITLLERRDGDLISFRAFALSWTDLDLSPNVGLMSIKHQPRILYYDDFDGPAGADVNGTTPDITTDGAVWSAGPNFDADGTVTYDNSSMGDSAYLPFVPQDGFIYRLSAKIDTRVSPFRNNANDWIGIGFTQSNASPELRFFDDSGVNNNPIYWAMSRTDQAVAPNYDQTFIGPKTAGGADTMTISADNIEIVLDTTAVSWVVSWYYNDVLRRTVYVDNVLKPNFQYVAMTNARADGFIDDFTLTQELP
jgi:hypothetical protein